MPGSASRNHLLICFGAEPTVKHLIKYFKTVRYKQTEEAKHTLKHQQQRTRKEKKMVNNLKHTWLVISMKSILMYKHKHKHIATLLPHKIKRDRGKKTNKNNTILVQL